MALVFFVFTRLSCADGGAVGATLSSAATTDEHIDALPRGSAGITAFKAYVAESRARGTTWTMISEAAVHEAERRSRALGDAKPIEADDLWKRTAADMASKPYKSLALDLVEACRRTQERSIDSFIEQGRTFHRRPADALDPGRMARERVRSKIATEEVAPHIADLAAGVEGNAALLREAKKNLESRLDKHRPEPPSPAPSIVRPSPSPFR